MPPPPSKIKIALTNHSPHYLSLQNTLALTKSLILEASQNGAQLIAFPELWIPGYPAWIWNRPVDFELGVEYVKNSLSVDGEEMRELLDFVGELGIWVVLGFSERVGDSLFISQGVLGPDFDDGGVDGEGDGEGSGKTEKVNGTGKGGKGKGKGKLHLHRRKLKPTHMERTIFGDASGGSCLSTVLSTPLGKVGALSCWEHIQPLLKFHNIAKGEQIHIAAWPVLDKFIEGSPGFWSMSEQGCLGLSQAYAVEAGCFVLHVVGGIGEEGIEKMKTAGSPLMGSVSGGSSAVVGPDGRVLVQGGEKDKLLFAELDMDLIVKAKTFADPSGHYSRPDLMWLGIDDREKKIVRKE